MPSIKLRSPRHGEDVAVETLYPDSVVTVTTDGPDLVVTHSLADGKAPKGAYRYDPKTGHLSTGAARKRPSRAKAAPKKAASKR